MNQPEEKILEQKQHFELDEVRGAFDRAAEGYDAVAVLQNEVCSRLLEKLDMVKITPERILDAGTGTGFAIPTLSSKYKKAKLVVLDLSENMLAQTKRYDGFLRSSQRVCGDIQNLPFESGSFDLIFSSLSLQWCNNLSAVFTEAKRVLKPGGLFVFTTFGPDTLKELRHSWAQVDDGNHVNDFIDMHDIGDALLHQGFKEPVMEAEILTVTYDSAELLMHDLKAIGANVTAKTVNKESMECRGLRGKSVLKKVCDGYERFRKNGLLPASYEIIYGHAWKLDNEVLKDAPEIHQFVDFKPR